MKPVVLLPQTLASICTPHTRNTLNTTSAPNILAREACNSEQDWLARHLQCDMARLHSISHLHSRHGGARLSASLLTIYINV